MDHGCKFSRIFSKDFLVNNLEDLSSVENSSIREYRSESVVQKMELSQLLESLEGHEMQRQLHHQIQN